MQAAPLNLAPILLCSAKGRRQSRHYSKGEHIMFDEGNLKETRRESLLARGISSRVDEVGRWGKERLGGLRTNVCPDLYECHSRRRWMSAHCMLGETFPSRRKRPTSCGALPRAPLSHMVRAGERISWFLSWFLTPIPPFSPFLPSPDSEVDDDELLISYVDADGSVKFGHLIHVLEGMVFVLESEVAEEKVVRGPHFERLSHLLLHYASEMGGKLLMLTAEQQAALSDQPAAEEGPHHKQGTTGKGHQGPYKELKADNSWYRRKWELSA
jgi:hypothetical protein